MSAVAVDASVAASLLFDEEHSERAAALFADAARTGMLLLAPFLLPVEVTNVVRKRMRADNLTLDVGRALLARFERLSIDLLEPPGLHGHALELAAAHSLGAHDVHYVALADLAGCKLWTGDARILRAVRGRLPFVRWIGDYEPSGAG